MEREFYKGGRPPIPEEKRSEVVVRVRFTRTEYDRLIERKDTTMAPDLSKFIRAVCLEKPLLMKSQMETYQDAALSLIREMRTDLLRIGVNVNQSARRINSSTDYHDLRHSIDQMTQDISNLEVQLGEVMATISGAGRIEPIHKSEYDCQNK